MLAYGTDRNTWLRLLVGVMITAVSNRLICSPVGLRLLVGAMITEARAVLGTLVYELRLLVGAMITVAAISSARC